MYEDIISFTRQNDGAPFFAGMCGISYCDGTYHITRNNSNISVIEYVVSGIGTVTENNNTFEAGEGDVYILDVYILKEGSFHDHYSDSDNPWVKIWLNFSGELARQITRCYGLENYAHFHAPEIKPLFDEIYTISRSKKSPSDISDDIAGCFLKIAQSLSYKIRDMQTCGSSVALRLKEQIDNMTDFLISVSYFTEYASLTQLIVAFS